MFMYLKDGNCLRKLGVKGANSGQFNCPSRVSFLNDNEILITNKPSHRLQHINIQTGTGVESIGKHGTGKGELNNPVDVCLYDKRRIAVIDFWNNRIQ